MLELKINVVDVVRIAGQQFDVGLIDVFTRDRNNIGLKRSISGMTNFQAERAGYFYSKRTPPVGHGFGTSTAFSLDADSSARNGFSLGICNSAHKDGEREKIKR